MNAQYNQWLEMNRTAMSPILRWNELVAQSTEKLARQGLALAQDIVDLGTRQLQLAGEVKDPQKWALEESKIVSEFGKKTLGRAGDYMNVSKEIRESMAGWTESAGKVAAESMTPKAS